MTVYTDNDMFAGTCPVSAVDLFYDTYVIRAGEERRLMNLLASRHDTVGVNGEPDPVCTDLCQYVQYYSHILSIIMDR